MEPVVVIGGGIIGTSVAYHLTRRDQPVHLVEKDALGAGTSSKSVAVFIWHQDAPDPVEHRIRERSWETYGPLVEAAELSFSEIGSLHLAWTRADSQELRDMQSALQDLGVTARWVDPPELLELGLDPEGFTGGVLVPEDGYLDPAEIIQYFASRAREAGATIETGVEVTGIETRNGSVEGVRTTDGHIESRRVVNAAGPWAPTINDMVGLELPLRHTLGPIVVLQRDEPFAFPFTVLGDDIYFREEANMQAFGGRYDTDYETATRLNPDANLSVDHQFYLDVAAQIDRHVPVLVDAEIVSDWVGVRTVTPDRRPFVGETPVAGFYTAVGMSGLGVTRAPAVGSMLAGIIEGKGIDPDIRGWSRPLEGTGEGPA
ncbi:MAG: NAD(P)/FAD-dependent oxidoreductase [Halodesulfurarchaeum sp.]